MIHYSSSRDSSGERGNVILIFLLALSAVLAIVAMVVDLPRRDIVSQEAQTASDAAALAAASHLDGTLVGWQDACSFAEASLGTNTVNAALASTQAYTISLGFYGANAQTAEESDFEFQPLATVSSCSDLPVSGVHYGMPVWALANAVRVEVTAPQMTTYFARAIGIKTLGSLTRRGTAAASTEFDRCVAPLAIPACQLMLNTDPNDVSKYDLDEYNPALQCQRELIFTESSPWDPLPFEERGHGLIRHVQWRRPPLVRYATAPNECGKPASRWTWEKSVNCRADSIRGVLGIPSNDPSRSAPATPAELVAHFKVQTPENRGCVRTRLGQRFIPLEDAVDTAQGLLKDESPSAKKHELATRLAQLINDPQNPRVVDVFENAQGTPLPNFPFIRSSVEERTITWPPYTQSERIMIGNVSGGGTTQGKNWTIPTSHSPLIPPNCRTGTASGACAAGPSRVWPVEVMVIAPADSNYKYCDYKNLFTQQPQSSTSPWLGTDPRVVGFVTAYLIDFNFENLSLKFPRTDVPSITNNSGEKHVLAKSQ